MGKLEPQAGERYSDDACLHPVACFAFMPTPSSRSHLAWERWLEGFVDRHYSKVLNREHLSTSKLNVRLNGFICRYGPLLRSHLRARCGLKYTFVHETVDAT